MLFNWSRLGQANVCDRRAPTQPWTVALVLALLVAFLMPSAMLAQRVGDGDGQPGQPVAVREAQPSRRHGGVQGQIIGGTPVAAGEFGFAAYVLRLGFGACTGSLIADRFVLTAAHCVEDADGYPLPLALYQVVIGMTEPDVHDDAHLRRVVAVWQHPDWDRERFATDIALLMLDAPASNLAKPVSLIGSGDTHLDQPGQAVTLVGWGYYDATNQQSRRLLKADQQIVSDATCDAAYPIDDIDLDVVICAIADQSSMCGGDSGGPLFATVSGNAAQGTATQAKAQKQHHAKGEGKKHKKHKHKKKHRKNRAPQETFVQIGVTNFTRGCLTDFPGGFTQLSEPSVHAFIDDIIGTYGTP